MRQRYKLLIAYCGTNYCGWQIQPNAGTIQEILENKVAIFLRHPIRIIGAGRTDAGVHALAQTAHFDSEECLDIQRFQKAMNGLLPPDIRVLEATAVPSDFHARFSAKGKIYHYHLYLDPVLLPFKYGYCLHIRNKLDMDLLRAAADLFIGTRDFTSFANGPNQGAAKRNPMRSIDRLDIIPEEGGLRLEFEGRSFLYKMVRNIVGLLLEVATGKRPIEQIAEIFSGKDRRLAAKAAPAHGLFLVKVKYGQCFDNL